MAINNLILSTENFGKNEKFLPFRQAQSVEDHYKCFRLLHDAYVDAGYSDKLIPPLRILPEHCNHKTRVLMANITGNPDPIWTASVFSESLPIEKVFKKEIHKLREKGKILAEIGCLATDKNFRMRDQKIPMLGNVFAVRYIIDILNADVMVIAIHPRHLKFYRDLLLFEQLSYKEEYSIVKNHPVVVLYRDIASWGLDLKKVYDKENIYNLFFKYRQNVGTLLTTEENDDKYFGEELINNVLCFKE